MSVIFGHIIVHGHMICEQMTQSLTDTFNIFNQHKKKEKIISP